MSLVSCGPHTIPGDPQSRWNDPHLIVLEAVTQWGTFASGERLEETLVSLLTVALHALSVAPRGPDGILQDYSRNNVSPYK